MIAEQKSIATILREQNSFKIPIYQRGYDWGADVNPSSNEITIFLEDLFEFINDATAPTYYFGNLIVKQESAQKNNSFILVDGQQRLTTFFLLLIALHDYLTNNLNDKNTDPLLKKIETYLFSYENKQKIVFDQLRGAEDFKKLLNKQDISGESSYNFISNYQMIYSYLKNQDQNIIFFQIEKLLDEFENIQFSYVILDSRENEHKIFENINSKGKTLSLEDLIKNYFYIESSMKKMDDGFEKNIEEYFEKEMSNIFSTQKKRNLFFRNFVGIKIKYLPNLKNLEKETYFVFKEWMRENVKTKEELNKIFLELKRMSYIYNWLNTKNFNSVDSSITRTILNLFTGTKEDNNKLIGAYFAIVYHIIYESTINKLTWDDPLKCKPKFDQKMLNDFMFILERFYIMLFINKGSDKTITRDIPRFYYEAKLIDEKFSPENLYSFLSAKDKNDSEYKMFDLNELQNKLNNKMYRKNKPFLVHLLLRIELNLRAGINEEISNAEISRLQIEHIMPQIINPFDEAGKKWILDLGDDWENVHNQSLELLGNYTIVLNNQSLGNKEYSEKKKDYKKSLYFLTKEIGDNWDVWNEDSINERTNLLFNQIRKII